MTAHNAENVLRLSAGEMADMLARALQQAHDEEGVCSCWPGPCRLTAYAAWKKDQAKAKAQYAKARALLNDGQVGDDA